MPGVSLHTAFALDLLSASPLRHTNTSCKPELRGAFLLGAFAPDLGYVTPGLRHLSLMAHLGPTVRLAEQLIRTARRPRDLAFAWGWYSHVVADIAVHPLINGRVTDLVNGQVQKGVLSERQLLHFRVEMGLDTMVYALRSDVRDTVIPRIWDAEMLRWLAEGFSRFHGGGVSAWQLRAGLWGAHVTARLTGHIQHAWGRGGGHASHLAPHPPAEALVHALGRFRKAELLGPQGPIPVSPDLHASVWDTWPLMTNAFASAIRDGLSGVPDRNLDDGTLV